MSMLNAFMGVMGKIGQITVDADWGSDSGASPVSSAVRTLTVPAGNPGSLDFDLAGIGAGSMEYRKNGGSYILVTDGMDVVFANGDTVQFKFTGVAPDLEVVTVTDNLRGDSVGGWSGEVT